MREEKLSEIGVWKLFFIYLLCGVIGSLIAIGYEKLNKDLFGINFSLMLVNILVLLWFYFFAWRKKFRLLKWSNFDMAIKTHWKEILWLVVINILLSLGIVFLLAALIFYVSPNFYNDLMSNSQLGSGLDFLIFSPIAAVMIAPIVEELIFRGVIFKRLEKKWNFWFGVIISSVCFGLIHLELAIVGAIIFGLSMCFLYAKTKVIEVPIIAHIGHNLIIMPFTYLSLIGASQADAYRLTPSEALVMLTIGVLLILIFGFFLLRYFLANKSVIQDI